MKQCTIYGIIQYAADKNVHLQGSVCAIQINLPSFNTLKVKIENKM
jgi:hypothetical protein